MKRLLWLSATALLAAGIVFAFAALRWRGGTSATADGVSSKAFEASATGSGPGSGGISAGLPPAPTVQLSADELPRVVRAFQKVAAAADRSSFDVRAKAARLKTEVAEAFSFVRDRIVTEVYPGVLRGPDGTLSASAGNDADKALLLAALLTAQNRRVRYVHCSLDDAHAEELVGSMFVPSTPLEPTDLESVLKLALKAEGIADARATQLVDARAASRHALGFAVRQTAENDLGVVRTALAQASIAPRPVFDRAALLAEARSHVWVQVEVDDGWRDLDPSFPRAQPGEAFCPAAEVWTEPPADLYQTVTFRVRNESVENGAAAFSIGLEQRVTTAELHGQPILLINFVAPTDSTQGAVPGVGSRFVPVLIVGDQFLGGEEFQPLPVSGEGRDVLGGNELVGGEGRSGAVLVAQYLDIEMAAPGRTVLVTRTLLDMIDPPSRARGDFSASSDPSLLLAALVQPHAIVMSTGRLDHLKAADAVLARLNPDLLGRAFAGAPGKPTDEALRDLVSLEHVALLSYAELFTAMADDALVGGWRDTYPNTRVYRDRPSVTVVDRVLRRSPDNKGLILALSLDMRENHVRVVPKVQDRAEDAFWLNLHYGLIGGALERYLFAYAPFDRQGARANPDALSTTAVFELARSSGLGAKAAVGRDASDLLHREFSAAGGDRLATEVTETAAVVYPERPVRFRDEDRFGLWTIDLTSGHSVPMLDTGLRQDMSEMDRLNTHYFRLARNCIKKFGVKDPLCEELVRMFQYWNGSLRDYFRAWDLLENTVIKALPLL